MSHFRTLSGAVLSKGIEKAGCGECQTSCQSACKTSCTVANQMCERLSTKEEKTAGYK